MSNMSYCRFENTTRDLDDCLDALQNEPVNELSDTEFKALLKMLRLAEELLEYKDEIKDAEEDRE
jgi:hypothetical protein